MQQLPRGRHGLAREEVIASQRGRMLAAMADAVAEKTFARTTVTDAAFVVDPERSKRRGRRSGAEPALALLRPVATVSVVEARSR